MKVCELIDVLQQLPDDAQVSVVYEGCARMDIGNAWLANSGKVVIAGEHAPIYYDEDRPKGAPSEEEISEWIAD